MGVGGGERGDDGRSPGACGPRMVQDGDHFMEGRQAYTFQKESPTARTFPSVTGSCDDHLHCHRIASDSARVLDHAMDDKDNANPTILNPSDLPSRRSETTVKRRDNGSTGLFDDLIPRYNYLNDPFEEAVSASGSDSDDDDVAVESIDEQEIYGAPPMCLPFPRAPLADHSHDRPHFHHL
jgi:hypothetical protein